MKIFVTGVAGSGKTTLARSLAAEKGIPYISFDSLQPYEPEKSGYSAQKYMGELPDAFVLDAIPFDEDYSWRSFTDYEQNHEAAIICVYCPDRDVLLARHQKRQTRAAGDQQMNRPRLLREKIARALSSPENFKNALVALWRRFKSRAVRILSRLPYIKNQFSRDLSGRQPHRFSGAEKIKSLQLKSFRRFYSNHLNLLKQYQNVTFFDSIANEYTSRETAIERLKTWWFPLEDHLYHATYDVGYQDIEVIDFLGYSNSYGTWESIKDEIHWSGKKCVDLGCFHGYFCFKMEDEGAQVTGLERVPAVIETTKMINQLRGGNVTFKQWVGGEPLPECDVVLCLNVLHHFGGPDIQEKALLNIHAPEAIFEVNRDQVALIKKHFDVKKTIPSHRYKRKILVCTRKN